MNWGFFLVGALVNRALLFGVCIRAPDFWKVVGFVQTACSCCWVLLALIGVSRLLFGGSFGMLEKRHWFKSTLRYCRCHRNNCHNYGPICPMCLQYHTARIDIKM